MTSRNTMVLSAAVLFGSALCGQQPKTAQQPYWDSVYSQSRPIFSTQPTELLKYAIRDRPPGRALDIGMGQGRNSIFLAQQGWDVTGFDPSPAGVQQAQAVARKLNLHLKTSVAREEDFELGHERWDLIVMTYVRRLNGADSARFQQALKPGGILVYENNNVGERNETLRAFLAYRIVRFEDIDAHSDWHPDKLQQVERLICQRP